MEIKYDSLIEIIDELKEDSYGTWIIDKIHKGTANDPIQMPFPAYTACVDKLIDNTYLVVDENPDLQLCNYYDLLKERGIDNMPLEEINVESMDAQGVLAVLVALIRSERFCDGAILSACKSGTVLKWLQRLKSIKESENINMDVIGFYDPNKEYGCFSNWYASDFEVDNTKYWCAEQYMMHKKALMFGANDTAEKIMRENDLDEIKRLGRQEIPNYIDSVWDIECQRIMHKGLYNKFKQNPHIKDILISTNDSTLAECAVNDHKWGIGLDLKDDRVNYPHKWCGRNLLGYILMKVRNDLKYNKAPTFAAPGFKIKVEKADITKLNVDVIVNAANKSLLGGGGVDGAIHRAAGPLLLKECQTLNGAETGEVKITNGYNLLAKKIIHTPGPVWKGGKHHEKGQLANCWRRSLCLAKENNLHSIAFPSISTGVYNYPMDEASQVAMKEVVEFIYNNPDYDISITIAAFDDKTKHYYEDALNCAISNTIPVIKEPIINQSINRIVERNIFALSFAEGGAMGSPGEVILFENHDNEYFIKRGNYAYGDLDIGHLMSHLHLDKVQFVLFDEPEGIPESWKHVDLGCGNHLFLRNDIYKVLKDKYTNMEPSSIGADIRYAKFLNLISDYSDTDQPIGEVCI